MVTFLWNEWTLKLYRQVCYCCILFCTFFLFIYIYIYIMYYYDFFVFSYNENIYIYFFTVVLNCMTIFGTKNTNKYFDCF